MARQIKLNGRELALLRTIGFGLGVTGEELQERMAMMPDELVDILNTMLDSGYVEVASMKQQLTVADLSTETFELNPAFTTDLKEALKRR
ncbi:MAG: hypothetical protein RL088_1827 [Verrucomicrobiota bacterium]|jgi:hypothetical protein